MESSAADMRLPRAIDEVAAKLHVAGVTVRVVQDPDLSRHETGSYLWEEASEQLVNHVLLHCGGSASGFRFLDLGCGCGSVGNALALLGGCVTLTDVPELLQNVRENIVANSEDIGNAGGHARAAALNWCDPLEGREAQLRSIGPLDVVVGSELLYAAALNGDTHEPLISTIAAAIDLSNSALRRLQPEPRPQPQPEPEPEPKLRPEDHGSGCSKQRECVAILAGEYHFGYEDLFFEEAAAAGLHVEVLHKDSGTLKVLLVSRKTAKETHCPVPYLSIAA